MADEQVRLTVKRQLTAPDSPPKPAHKFAFFRVGTDVSLEVGHYDMPELQQAVEKARSRAKLGQTDPVEVTLYVTDRFFLTPQNISDLVRIAGELQADMAANLVAPEPEAAPEKK